MNFKPTGDFVLVEPDIRPDKVGSIIIPDHIEEKPQEGKVVAVGTGRVLKDRIAPLNVKVGDRILFARFGGTEIKIEEKDYLIMKEEDILGTYE